LSGSAAGLDQPITAKQAQSELTNTLFANADADLADDLQGIALVERIDCYLEEQTTELSKLKEIRTALTKRGRALHNSKSAMEQGMMLEGVNAGVNRDAGTGYVVLPNIRGGRTQISLYDEVLAPSCSDKANAACAMALKQAQTLWWIAGRYRAFANNFNQQAKQKSLAFNQDLEQQWHSYKNDTIKLWPQELLLNSLVYQPSQRGLSAPPNYKLLALRPSLGLSYLSDQSHSIQPTINVDLLGVYWWNYDGPSAGQGRGISASLIWDGDDTAYGVSYHHNPKWSATIAEGDDNDLVLSISFQLAYWFLKR
jgi:hypothetical protein